MELTLVGFGFLLLSLAGFRFAFVEMTRLRFVVLVMVWVLHLLATVVYYDYVQTNPADTGMYYYDPLGWYGTGFQLNTYVVIWLVQTLKLLIGGSYFDYFLLFQAFGFWGLAIMMRTFEEVYRELGIPQGPVSYLLLFLPGMHFWTSPIGKDSLLFLASAAAVWAAMQIQRRFIVFGAAIVLMVLVRPHVALIALMALALATFFDPRTKGYMKAGLLVVALAGLGVVAGTVRSTFRLDVTSVDSVSDFLTTKSEVFETIEGGSAVIGASFPERVLSLLFRPMFVDAEDMFGLIASAENLLLLIIVGTILFRLGTAAALARQALFLRFSLLFALGLVLMLSAVYYNVGLGLRQKMMMMPALLTFFVSLIAVRRVRRHQAALGYA
ncbi:MAG: hypothetical protein ACK40O_06345 [Allosphingosinicella sp.]